MDFITSLRELFESISNLNQFLFGEGTAKNCDAIPIFLVSRILRLWDKNVRLTVHLGRHL
jgi:hypothetical protein